MTGSEPAAVAGGSIWEISALNKSNSTEEGTPVKTSAKCAWCAVIVAALVLGTAISNLPVKAADQQPGDTGSAQAAMDRAQAAAQRASCQNNLKQMGLIFKMFANESKGQCYPQLSPEPGRLMFSHEKGEQTYPVYPDYLTDLNVLICPGDKKAEVLKTPEAKKDPGKLVDDHSYFYLGYVVHNDADVKAFADAYKARVAKGLKFNEDLDGPQGKIYQLREGIERKLVTDASNPAAAAKAQSEIPVLIERPGHHEPDGGNVLFMDGHVEFIRMGGNWPMAKETLDILKSLDEMKATKK